MRQKEKIQLVMGIVFIYILLNILHIGCPIKFITGIACAGCGMTRACISVLQLNFQKAYYYHPLFFLIPVMGTLLWFRERFNPAFLKLIWAIVIVIFIVVYVIRLFFFQNEIVSIHLNEGFLVKLFLN